MKIKPGSSIFEPNLFGVEIGGTEDGFSLTDRAAFESARNVGAKFIDLRPLWSTLETKPGVYDWTTLDTALENAEAVGLPVTITVRFFDNQVPEWLTDENMIDQEGRDFLGYGFKGKHRSPSYWGPKARKSYLLLVSELVKRYCRNLDEYPALLDANSEVLNTSVIKKLVQYVKKGGRLVLLCRSGRYALEGGRTEYTLLKELKILLEGSLPLTNSEHKGEKNPPSSPFSKGGIQRGLNSFLETWSSGKGEVLQVSKEVDWNSPEGEETLLRMMEWLKVERPITAAPGVLSAVSKGKKGEIYVILHSPKAEPIKASFAIRKGILKKGNQFKFSNLFDSDTKTILIDCHELESGVTVTFEPYELKVLKIEKSTHI